MRVMEDHQECRMHYTERVSREDLRRILILQTEIHNEHKEANHASTWGNEFLVVILRVKFSLKLLAFHFMEVHLSN